MGGLRPRGAVMNGTRGDLVGLVPACGLGSRVSPLPMSKELYPVGFCSMPGRRGLRPKVAAHCLLESMRAAGADRAFVVLRKGKWDIPSYFGEGKDLGMRLAYLAPGSTPGVPYTVDTAYPYVRTNRVAFGFPDIIHEPENALGMMADRQEACTADVVLGLFPAHRCEKMDMVELGPDGRVARVVIKPERTTLFYTWILAVWTAAFSGFLHEFVARHNRQPESPGGTGRELYMGDVLQEALDCGMTIEALRFDKGRYLDIGTPEDLIAAARMAAGTTKEKA
jgi:glucose-1-phosphate thymidylyltransferase